MKHCWALGLGAVLTLILLWPDGAGRIATAAAGKGPQSEPMLQLIWQREMSRPASLVSSPDGKLMASISPDGTITCFSPKGGTMWRVRLEGVDSAAIGPDGSAIACRLLSPAQDTVYFISPKGRVFWRNDARGAIWSVGSSVQAGQFAVGTGERYCYVYNVTDRRHRYRRWRLPGAPCSLEFSPGGKSLVVGTWQDAGVGVFGIRGERISWWKGRPDRLYSAEMTRDGSSFIVSANPNPNQPPATMHLKNRELNDVWSRDFSFLKLTSDANRNGDYVAIGYQHDMEHNGKVIPEKRIALYNSTGRRLWEKGGLFGQWNLLQVCSSGNILLYDDSSSMCLVNLDGKIVLRSKLPADVIMSARSPQRDRIVLYCANGQLLVYSTR